MEQLMGNATFVDNSLKETTTHGTKEFPFIVYLNDFSSFQNGHICWHWHTGWRSTFCVLRRTMLIQEWE